MKRQVFHILILLLAVILYAASPVCALDWDLKGSLGEGEHKHYIPPVSNPFQNETPFITTEIRPVFLHNDVPDSVLTIGGPGGGHINLFAVQLRVALTDRLGFIFNKNGWVNFNHKDNPALSDEALANLGLGLKYALISDPKQETLVTAGITYEVPSGTLKAGTFRLSGDGNGFINTFVTAAESYNKVGVQAMIGTKISLDGERNVSWFNYSLHMDYEILPNFFPLVEFNGFVPLIENSRQNTFDFEGLDLVSIGGADPESVTTFAVGSRYRLANNVLGGIAYEFPLTDDKDIMDWRITADLVIHY